MIIEADTKLRTLLSDVDPFWIKWGYWMDSIKEVENKWPLRKYDGSDWLMGRTEGINECMSALKVVGWQLVDNPDYLTTNPAICSEWHKEGQKVVAVYIIK